jgi:DNA mismatch endonuclease (patch repair protein)
MPQGKSLPDPLTPEQRRKTMQAVKSTGTSPERKLEAALHALGLDRWEAHCPTLPGKPDFTFHGARVAVFVDGGFWHGHPTRYWQGRSGEYWDKKIARNQERDRQVDTELRALGWTVIRVWDFEVQKDAEDAARRVEDALNPSAVRRVAEAPGRGYDARDADTGVGGLTEDQIDTGDMLE